MSCSALPGSDGRSTGAACRCASAPTLRAPLFAGILFSHPADFTPVCTTELGTVAKYMEEFSKRSVKLCAISCDDVDSHVEWIKDICASQGCAELGFPIIADPSRELITMLGMIGAPMVSLRAWS